MYLPSEVTENELNNEDGPIASSSSQPQKNHEESDSSECTDRDADEMDVAAANTQEQIDFDTSRAVESHHSSPTILSENIVVYLLQDNDINISSRIQKLLRESSSKKPVINHQSRGGHLPDILFHT